MVGVEEYVIFVTVRWQFNMMMIFEYTIRIFLKSLKERIDLSNVECRRNNHVF